MISHAEAESRVMLGLKIHAAAYVAANLGMAALNLTRNPDHLWFPWVVAGWGAGLALHAAILFAIPGGRERAIQRVSERVERRRQRHGASD